MPPVIQLLPSVFLAGLLKVSLLGLRRVDVSTIVIFRLIRWFRCVVLNLPIVWTNERCSLAFEYCFQMRQKLDERVELVYWQRDALVRRQRIQHKAVQ